MSLFVIKTAVLAIKTTLFSQHYKSMDHFKTNNSKDRIVPQLMPQK